VRGRCRLAVFDQMDQGDLLEPTPFTSTLGIWIDISTIPLMGKVSLNTASRAHLPLISSTFSEPTRLFSSFNAIVTA
jgi:hypothetical protein